jgi:hypothetical protein
MKITVSQLREIIREEIQKVNAINEATLVSSRKKDLSSQPLKKGDMVFFQDVQNDRGMRLSTGIIAGKVTKVIGSKNVEVAGEDGDVYNVSKNEITVLPEKGKKVAIATSGNYGAGSGSQGNFDDEGVVLDVDLKNKIITLKAEDNSKIKIHFRSINTIYSV